MHEEKQRKSLVVLVACFVFSSSLKKQTETREILPLLLIGMWGGEEDGHGIRLSSEVHGERKGKSQHMQHRKLPLAIKMKTMSS